MRLAVFAVAALLAVAWLQGCGGHFSQLNDSSTSVSATGSGLTISPAAVNFGTVFMPGSVPPNVQPINVTVTNQNATSVQISSFVVSPVAFQIANGGSLANPTVLAPSDTIVFSIAFVPPVTNQSYHGKLTFVVDNQSTEVVTLSGAAVNSQGVVVVTQP